MPEPTDTTTIEREACFPVSPEELWDAVTDPDLLTEWFGNVDFDLTPGGAITDDNAGDGEPSTIGVVETFEPPRRIGFVWVAPGTDTPSSVELEIDDDTEADDGSVLHVREVRIEPRWEPRPTWFAPSACVGASARA